MLHVFLPAFPLPASARRREYLRCLLIVCVLLPLCSIAAAALPGGIVGRTLTPSCGACHGPSNANTTVTMTSSSGTFTVAPGGTLAITMVVAHSSKVAAGVNVAVHDIGGSNAGTLEVDNNSGLRTALGEITHSAPRLMVNGSATFAFTWTAPTAPGTYILRGSGNAVDNTGGSDNDEFNYLQNGPVYLNVVGQVAAPSLLAPADGAQSVSTTPTLSWTAVSGALLFEYQVSTSAAFTAIATSGTVYTASVALAGLQNGTQYYWRVRALSALSTSAYVSSSFATVSGPPTSLAMPSVVAPASGASGVPTTATLVWSVVPNALQYEYQISTRSNYSVLTASGTVDVTGATVGGLSYNTLYYWRVRSKYGSVLSGYRTATFTTIAGQPPVVVFPPLHQINIPATAATISWSALADAAGYTYQVSTEAAFAAPFLSVNTTSTSASLPPLVRNTQYFWRVRAYGTAMGTTPYASANFVTEVPRTAVRLRLDNAPVYSPKSFVPATVIVRTHDAAGAAATMTTATTLVFAENSPLIAIAGTTTAVLDMGAHTAVLPVVLRSATTSAVSVSVATTTVGLVATSQTITVEPLTGLDRVVHYAPVSTATALPVTTPTAMVWHTVEGATDYTLQVSTRADFSSIDHSVPVAAADPLATTATAAVQLGGPQQYWWRVQASNISTAATWSVPWTMIAGARFLAPVLLAPANGALLGTRAAPLRWLPVGEPSQYRVQVATTAEFTAVISDTTLGAAATSVAVTPASGYWWRVRAQEGDEQSAWSQAWSFTTQPLLLTHPVGGEWLLAQSTTAVTWASAGGAIDRVRIELSTNGTTWQDLTTATLNTGSYGWTTPDLLTTQALVRVSDATTASVSTSGEAFNIAPPAPLDVTVFLEGAYTSQRAMSTMLGSQGYLPLTDPYTGTVTVQALPPNTTDWVLVEFRPVPDAPGQVQPLLLRSDGAVTAPDGSTAEVVDISRIPPGRYHVVVRHRNHLDVMSAAALTITPTSSKPLDLSDAAQVYTAYTTAVKEVEPGVYTMIAGDAVADGVVSAPDRVGIRNATGQMGYHNTDITLDVMVNAVDRIMAANNRFAVTQVP